MTQYDFNKEKKNVCTSSLSVLYNRTTIWTKVMVTWGSLISIFSCIIPLPGAHHNILWARTPVNILWARQSRGYPACQAVAW